MASVIDMNGNFLLRDENVERDRIYKLEQFRQFYDLQPVGELLLMAQFCLMKYKSWARVCR